MFTISSQPFFYSPFPVFSSHAHSLIKDVLCGFLKSRLSRLSDLSITPHDLKFSIEDFSATRPALSITDLSELHLQVSEIMDVNSV